MKCIDGPLQGIDQDWPEHSNHLIGYYTNDDGWKFRVLYRRTPKGWLWTGGEIVTAVDGVDLND
jgi:hypothetical protein